MPPINRQSLLAKSNKVQDDVADGKHNVDDANHSFFQRGRDFEAVGDAHTYTAQEQKILASFDSLEYLPPNNKVYRDYLSDPFQERPSQTARWLAMGLIGVSVGIVGFLLKSIIDRISEWRRSLIFDVECTGNPATPSTYACGALTTSPTADSPIGGTYGTIYPVWMLIAVAFACAASAMVVLVQPSAASSGIPEVIAYLNGTHQRKIFNVRTLTIKVCVPTPSIAPPPSPPTDVYAPAGLCRQPQARDVRTLAPPSSHASLRPAEPPPARCRPCRQFISCFLAVGSGLPVGPEGPMIHMGAMIGRGVSQMRSRTIGINLPMFRHFRNNKDARDFLTAGAAAGVASAFGAPVGGLLFALEEVASTWSQTLTWQIFFCAMSAASTTIVLSSSFGGFECEHACIAPPNACDAPAPPPPVPVLEYSPTLSRPLCACVRVSVQTLGGLASCTLAARAHPSSSTSPTPSTSTSSSSCLQSSSVPPAVSSVPPLPLSISRLPNFGARTLHRSSGAASSSP